MKHAQTPPDLRPTLPHDLLAVMAALDEPADLARLMGDLLSMAEVRSLGERWAIVKALADGRSQRGVRDEVGCSVATVSRGAKQLRYGTGGFQHAFGVLSRLGLPGPRSAEDGPA
jgi:Trp operon repressor